MFCYSVTTAKWNPPRKRFFDILSLISEVRIWRKFRRNVSRYEIIFFKHAVLMKQDVWSKRWYVIQDVLQETIAYDFLEILKQLLQNFKEFVLCSWYDSIYRWHLCIEFVFTVKKMYEKIWTSVMISWKK